MFSVLMSPWKTFRAWQSLKAHSNWKASHFFSISSRKGRVLFVSVDKKEQEWALSPHSIVQRAIEILSNQVAVGGSLKNTLIGEGVRDVGQGIAFT